jgi:hypothetical protein
MGRMTDRHLSAPTTADLVGSRDAFPAPDARVAARRLQAVNVK